MPSGQPSLLGATIGNYRVAKKLGEGGMGAVYLAEHPQIGKRVALKVLHPELAANQDVVARFFNEARAVNDIGHPNIVDVIDYGTLQPAGQPAVVYFIMELLQGEPLRAILAREAPLPTERALHIAIQIGNALAASHDKGVIHRDLKPDNVFLIQRGRESDFVKVLDFGIAKLTGGGPAEMSRTRTGVVMGTPAYMSPEQCEGRRGIDARTDVYALGVILYEMIVGRVPFTGEGYGEILLMQMTQAPVRPSTVRGVIPRAVEAIVMKALEKRRERRFASMAAMVAALRDPDAFLAGEGAYEEPPASQRATTVPERRTRGADASAGAVRGTTLSSSAAELGIVRPRSRTPVIATSAAVVLLGLGGAAYLLLGKERAPVEEGPIIAAAAPPPVAVAPTPAPAPSPAPVAAPAPPATITLTVTSMPPGATLFVGNEDRGQTPLVVQLPRGDGDVGLVLKLDGYKDKVKTVRASRDTELEVTLERASRRPHHDKPAAAPEPAKQDKPAPPADEEILPPTF